jgi:2-alkyl-3-oxoalkanoate reductase
MRVFVAGATGVVGRRLTESLAERGHDVVGMTRDAVRARALAAAGVEPAVCDVYDAPAVTDAVRRARPDVVVHLLTALSQRFDPREGTRATDRVRREGTRILLRAAGAAGVARVVAESVAFLYAPAGGAIKDEGAPLFLDAPGALGRTAGAVADLERQVLAGVAEPLVLRFGWLYGPGTWYARDGSVAHDVRRRRLPIVGRGGGVYSFVHADDAAAACVAAVEGRATGVLNIVDDEPAPVSEWLPAYARELGAPRPLRVPAALARLIAGAGPAIMATRMRGASNAAAARVLGWRPAHASWRDGLAS